MGSETSKSSSPKGKVVDKTEQIVELIKQIENPEIKKILPLVVFDQDMKEIFPPDISIKPEFIEEIYDTLKEYLSSLSEDVESNQCELFSKMSEQLARMSKIDNIHKINPNKYSDFMENSSVLLSEIKSSVDTSIDALNKAIERADRLAKEISTDIPSFKEFNSH